MWGWLFCVAIATVLAVTSGAGAGAARLICYSEGRTNDFEDCTHLVYAGDARGDKLDAVLKEYRRNNPKLKIIVRVSEDDKDLRGLLKSKHAQGLEVHDAHKSLNKTKVLETVEAARAAISASGGGPLFLALPAHPELLAKYYNLHVLIKKVDLMMVQTHALGVVKKMTYHPSRLSGLWDMMNTDSVVDLVIGLGVPASKIVISLPATVRQFHLLNETLSTPGSPTTEDEPKEVDQAELCRQLQKGKWTLERDQDLSAPYAFKDKTWLSFEDSSSVDVKGKYARVRGLAGLALDKADSDLDTPCGLTLKAALAKVLNQQSRAPRAAVLRSLEHEILSAPGHARPLDALQVSPYRITQIVDSDGVIHSIREDTRTEFSCSRQGYFVHPRSCARFYRCVKFDQLSPEYTVFEFDCPAGLAFDARYEVCVWPGSLPDSQACPGSSEIAPVPRTRFICPQHEGYYADPENCRWFFACLDHGKAPLTAYEFRCPFGLGFDAEKLKCDWPWLVPACGNIGRYEAEAFGYGGAALTGATGFHGQTADAVNIAAHQSLVSGASLDNLVGIQNGFLSLADSLDSNFITSQELSHDGQNYQVGHGVGTNGLALGTHSNVGLVQPTKYNSGSIILDDYRLPTKAESAHISGLQTGQLGLQNGQYYASSFDKQKSLQYQTADYDGDNSGAYIHDPTGDYAEPYKHIDSPNVPYLHKDYKSRDYNDYGRYSASQDYNGQFAYDNSGAAFNGNSGSYNTGYSGSYTSDDSGKYVAGVYRTDGHIGSHEGERYSTNVETQHGGYGSGNSAYLSDTNAYTGGSHTLTAGAVNVGLVGKTTLVNANYNDQFNYNTASTKSFSHDILHQYNNGHVPIIQQSGVSINHIGTDGNNLDGYSFVTTPTSSGVPTTATPFASTTAIPVTTYKTTFVPEAPKTDIKQIFGYQQPEFTYVQPTVSSVKQYVTPNVQITDYNQGYNYQASAAKSESSGYVYSKPNIKFEDGVTYTTAAPVVVSTFRPQGFSHNQQTVHKLESPGYQYSTPVPVTEEPFKKVVAYTTGPPLTYAQPSVATYVPQSFSHQTIHKTEVNSNYLPSVQTGYEYSKPTLTFEEPKTVIEHTTAQPVAVSTYQPQGFSHETVHKVDASQVNTYDSGYKYEKPSGYDYYKPVQTGYEYSKPALTFEEPQTIIEHTTAQPAVISTYQPQSYSHETVHKIDTSQLNTYDSGYKYEKPSGYEYSKPLQTGYEYSKPTLTFEEPKTIIEHTTAQPAIISAYQPQSYSHETVHKVDVSQVNTYDSGYKYEKPTGYTYSKPEIQFEEAPKTVIQYTTPSPVVSSYRPQTFSHQTIHQYVPGVASTPAPEITYHQPAVSVYQNPILKYATPIENVTPVTYIQPTAQSYSHQVHHKIESNNYVPSIQVDSGYNYEAPKSVVEYTTARPVVTTTYIPQIYSHETIHKVEAGKVNTYSNSESGYHYEQPAVKFEETPAVVQYTTSAPAVSTYKPQIYSQQTYHNINTQQYIPVSTPAPKVEVYHQPAVTVNENPILKFTQDVSPSPAYTPVVQQHDVHHGFGQDGYSYSQPEIQRETLQTLNAAQSYSDASLVSHQTYHQYNNKNQESGKDVVFVSSTPSTLVYEDHYAEYETPKYKAAEYVPPKSYSVSTVAPSVARESSVYHQAQDQYDYNQYSQDAGSLSQVAFTTSHVEQPKTVESTHFSSVPEIQVGYKAEDYLPPQDDNTYLPPSTTARPVVTSTYRPPTYSTTVKYLPPPQVTLEYLPAQPEYTVRENLPPKNPTYLPPRVDNSYLPPSTTARPRARPTTKAPEYLPPLEETGNVVNFDSFGYKTNEADINVNPYQFTFSSTPRTNLLGFGTVGPDAGLVGSVTYTTGSVSSTYLPPVTSTYRPPVTSTYAPTVTSTYLPPVTSTYLPPRNLRTRVKPKTKNPEYLPPVQSTTFKAPEYLPPVESNVNYGIYGLKNEQIASNSYRGQIQRKQNIVVQTAKANQLGFGTVGSDAGLISDVTYSTAAPSVSNPEYYSVTPQTVTSTYAPVRQDFEQVSVRRSKPKVAVVTKINDFNPLLVRKLGAVCSCQTPVLVLKGKRPNVQVQEYDGYSDDNDYEDGRGDISDDKWALKSARLQTVKTVTPVSVRKSTFNPIIVPDDSFYQDIQDSSIEITPKSRQIYSQEYVSSTPVYSSTQKVVKIRPRVKAVTVAPTYKTVVLNQEVAPNVVIKETVSRLRDELPDCQRAGLFRHPKQCNKFYACRWDCNKQKFTVHTFNCPVQLAFDPSLGACNWPSQGPACQGDTLLTNTL